MVDKVTVEIKAGEESWWVVSSPQMPGALSRGKTLPSALRNYADAVSLWRTTPEWRAKRVKQAQNKT